MSLQHFAARGWLLLVFWSFTFAESIAPLFAARRPNILFCIADDASYPHMGAYGCSWVKTPGFDRVAREGILFTNAYTPNAKCAPSRACILTGRNSWQLKEAGNHMCFFPAEFAVYTEVLAEHGYFVGKTGKGWGPGIALDAQGRKRQLAGKPFDRIKNKPPAKGISNINYAANFAQFLEEKPADQPFCFWYGGFEPHRGYSYGVGVSQGGKSLGDIDKVPGFWPDNDIIRNDMLDYAFEIEWFDKHLVRMLQQLERSGELDHTLVLVTADNGMPFPRVKGQAYEMSNHLPLAAMWPEGITNPGRTVDDYVCFIDFAPTFLEVAGVNWEETGMSPSPGRSLTDIFRSPRSGVVVPERDHVLIGKERHDIGRPKNVGYPIRGIVKQGLLYLRNYETSRWPAGNPETGYLNCDGSPTKTEILELMRTDPKRRRFWEQAFGKRPQEELYQLSTDPECLTNLADQPDWHEKKIALRKQMIQELKAQQDPRMFGQGHLFDEYPYTSPATDDFYERFLRGEKLRAGWVRPTDFEKTPLE